MTVSGSLFEERRSFLARRRHVPYGRAALILTCTFLALYFRRPDQLFDPYIWVEDGSVSLLQYIDHGWAYLFDPVAGYLILPSKLIQATSLTLSLNYYPEIAFWLTVVFHAGVLCAIAFSPTSLRFPLLCALFTLILPTDSEVFGTSLYAFWWGTLLIVPPLLWAADRESLLWPRIVMVVLGGLSSPLVIALMPLFALRNLLFRTRNTTIVTGIVLICSAVQIYFLYTSGTHGTEIPKSLNLAEVIRKFFGMFVFWSPRADVTLPWLNLALGSLLIASLVVAPVLARRRLAWRHAVLFLGMLAAITVSVTRMPPEITHPIYAGPRYFFYPYIFLGWLLIELIADVPRWFSVFLSLFLVAGLHQFVAYGPRGHHPMSWKQRIAMCIAAPGDYAMPVHFTGNRNDAWKVVIPRGGCRLLHERSLLDGP